jgi:hypothetical protein
MPIASSFNMSQGDCLISIVRVVSMAITRVPCYRRN